MLCSCACTEGDPLEEMHCKEREREGQDRKLGCLHNSLIEGDRYLTCHIAMSSISHDRPRPFCYRVYQVGRVTFWPPVRFLLSCYSLVVGTLDLNVHTDGM